jgi:hypothetical protein
MWNSAQLGYPSANRELRRMQRRLNRSPDPNLSEAETSKKLDSGQRAFAYVGEQRALVHRS